MATYSTIHTTYGLARIASAEATGTPINLTHFAVGDGSGSPVLPLPGMTALTNERWRTTINRIVLDPANPGRVYVEGVIPFDQGGWMIREIGIFDDAGQLFAVGNFPDVYKTIPSDGSSNDVVVRVELFFSNAAVITLLIDPVIAAATQAWVISNITMATLTPGGTTNQVLRKHSNTSGDVEWADPGTTTVLVDAIEEPDQALAALQATVNMTVCTTLGLVVFVDGIRIPHRTGAGGWQQGASNTQVILGSTYSAGAKFSAVQNFPAGSIGNPLQRALNLSDVASAATARINLDVYSKAEADQLTPAGNVGYTARSTAPTGWMVRDGSAVSRTTYARLFAAIGTLYGAGNGTTTFNLPDGRGAFDRGLDNGRGLDAGRTLGSYQADALGSHRHADGADGAFPGSTTGGGFAFVNQAGAGSGSNTGFTGGTETRPKNVAYLPIIKY